MTTRYTKIPTTAEIISLARRYAEERRAYSVSEPPYYPPLPYKVESGARVNCSSFAFRLIIEAYGITPTLDEHRRFHIATEDRSGPLRVCMAWDIADVFATDDYRPLQAGRVRLWQAWTGDKGHTFLTLDRRIVDGVKVYDATPSLPWKGVRFDAPWPWRANEHGELGWADLRHVDLLTKGVE